MKSKYWKIVRSYFVGWFIAMLLWELLRNTDQIPLHLTENSLSERIISFAMSWGSQALCYGVLHVFIDRYIKGRIPFARLLMVTLVLQIFVGLIILIVMFSLFKFVGVLESSLSLSEFILQPLIIVAFIYAIVTNFVIVLFIYILLLLGEGNLLKMMRGKFYKPKVEERVFMFVDLRDSTTIAEKLGHIKYSLLIQDCFYDLAVVHNYGAEICQYVGDEAVLVWPVKEGYKYINCINAFYAFQECIKKRKDHYMKEYNMVPEFKAGVNMGKITITEVGEFKREIAYYGDTINTAARIQGECNRLNSDLLISEAILNQIPIEPWLTASLKGQVQLKGKSKVISIYAIEKVE
ncbi:MAG: adenylate/guanylate cyclase domain-containing protein [Flavobacteriaceae bacterium]|nr:adenylate/guanylate cyclase domain-containing protein [Flavobacteriaceae bacterium]